MPHREPMATNKRLRYKQILDEQSARLSKNIDKLFFALLSVEFIAGIIFAVLVTPYTWIGQQKLVHLHVWAAISLGFLFVSLPLYFIKTKPGDIKNRYVIAISQMLMGALFIDLTGGRIETHFHVFGSLAILAAYREWRVMLLATAVVIADHFLRGVFFPQSLFGVINAGNWRWIEHAAWICFEDVFLIYIMQMSVFEMKSLASTQAELEITKNSIELLVDQRTQQLKNKKAELIEAIATAEQANRSKSAFLANMSHEIRTPINGVLGLTDVLLETELNEAQRQYLAMLQSSGLTLLAVVNDILDFSKIEAGKMLIEKISFNLRENLESTFFPLRHQAEQKGLSLRYEVESDVPERLVGDITRIRQILINLVGNALKFTQAGEVFVGAEITQQEDRNVTLHVWVKDSGIGLSPEQQERIFEPFAQADSSTTRKYGGTGLGLSIVVKLLQLMGGSLSIESMVGEGSCFHFTLPLETDASVLRTIDVQEVDVQVLQSGKPLDILLAEDNKINQRVARAILEKMHCIVSIAENGKQVLEMVEAKQYDLILMDMLMPEMDGLEATSTIRAQEKHSGAHLPIIALTANAMEEDRERCLKAGMDSFISKPFKKEELIAVMQSVLRRE